MATSRPRTTSNRTKSGITGCCYVCWTCKGLFFSKEEDIEKHRRLCHLTKFNMNSQGFDTCDCNFFVCDKADFKALTTLKEALRKYSKQVFASFHVQSRLPFSIIKVLLDLCLSDKPFNSVNKLSDSEINHVNDSETNRNEQIQFKNICSLNEINFNHNGIKESQEKKKVNVFNDKRIDKECQTIIYNPAVKCMKSTTSSVNAFGQNVNLNQEQKETDAFCTQSLSQPNTMSISGKKITDLTPDLKDKLSAQCNIAKFDFQSYYVCKLCSHKSKSDKFMLRHLILHNNGQDFFCETCKFSTIWRKEWTRHLFIHHGEIKFLCHVCARGFLSKDSFEKHMASFHSSSELLAHKFQCSDCNYLARNMTSLNEHRRKHTGEYIACPLDGCSFKSMYERSLNKHLKQKHSQEKTQICSICGFQTRHASSLSKHMMLHKDYKPYKCAQCSFTALYPSEIISHANSKHFKQKKYSCPTCSFKTSYSWAIQKHVARHEGPRGYTCSLCGLALESMLKAKKHIKLEHGCNDYQVIGETAKKLKPANFKIETNPETRLVNAFMVVNNDVIINESSCKIKMDETQKANVVSGMESSFLDVSLPSTKRSSSKNMSKTFERNIFTNSAKSSKGGNPMLCATTTDLGDNDNSLIEDSLLDLISDFPKPPTLNRCQSASTLMFASFSPHLIDRPLTPDFFTDSPSVGSYFPSFSSKHLDSDSLNLGNLSHFDTSAHPSGSIGHLASASNTRSVNPPSPILPSFINSPVVGTPRSINARLAVSPVQESECMDIMLPNTDLSVVSQLASSDGDSNSVKLSQVSFVTSKSAFASLDQSYSPEIQTAVACIPISDCLVEESPFPVNVKTFEK